MKIPFKVSLLLLVAIGLAPTSLYADDTEIYYSAAAADNSQNRPLANVMVLLDTSGSMRWCENSVSNVGWCSDPDNRRINMLEEAMHILIDSVPGEVRMGLGRFRSGSSDAGHVILPVTEITPKTKRVFKDSVSALNSAGESANGPGDPEGGTPTSSAYWEMSRYMVGDRPYRAKYGNRNDDDTTESVCLEYEVTENCETVPSSSKNFPSDHQEFKGPPSLNRDKKGKNLLHECYPTT